MEEWGRGKREEVGGNSDGAKWVHGERVVVEARKWKQEG